MKFLFWQNILSIHQSTFIRNLANQHSVYLIVEEGLDDTRIKHGWTIPDFGKANVINKPTNQLINELLEIADAIHIFTGICSFPMPTRVFNLAIAKNKKVGVMLEPFEWLGWKGKLRFLKYYILKMKYNSKIDFILAIGNRGRWCYEKVGFSKNKIFDWAYFTEGSVFNNNINKSHNLFPKLLFVGSIDERKNIIKTTKIVKKYLTVIDKFEIIGVGALEAELKLLTEDKIIYKGKINNSEIAAIMSEVDLLILPSIYDGWGAVSNESLMVGTPVLVSDHSGSSILINDSRGKVFSINKNNFEEKFVEILQDLKFGKFRREEIRNWSAKNISGESAANYFEAIINSIYTNKVRPKIPWLNS